MLFAAVSWIDTKVSEEVLPESADYTHISRLLCISVLNCCTGMRKRTQQEVCFYLFSENEFWGVPILDRWAEEKHGKSLSVVLVLDRKAGHTPYNSAGLRWWGVVSPPRAAESNGETKWAGKKFK